MQTASKVKPKRKKCEEPARIYSYGCRGPEAEEEVDYVIEQMRRALRYRNDLVEEEQKYLRARAELVTSLSPSLETLKASAETLKAELAEMREEVKLQNIKMRCRSATEEQREAIGAKVKESKAAWAAFKEERAKVFKAEANGAKFLVLKDEHDERIKALREQYSKGGLYWGTYLQVENAILRTNGPHRFRGWDGEGKVAVQLQQGLTLEAAFGGADTRLRLQAPTGGPGRAGKQARARVRVGSDAKGKPVWVTVRFTMHRPLPPGSHIKWVFLLRRRIATHFHWKLQFVITRAAGFPKCFQEPTAGVAALDVGWRLVPTGLRVAAWAGDDGAGGEFILPADRVSMWHRVDTLQQTRDDNTNLAVSRLQAWLKTSPGLPAWWKEQVVNLHVWRSRRLARLALYWRNNRFGGDDAAFTDLEAWRAHDRHLYEWQENQRARTLDWRDDFYRRFLVGLASRYRLLIHEDVCWANLMRSPNPESLSSREAIRKNRRIAAVGRFLGLLREQACESKPELARWSTQRCHCCGKKEPFVDKAELIHTCSHCNQTWDRDLNAARVLLAVATGRLPRV